MHPSGSAHVYGDLIFGKIRLSLSPLNDQQYVLLKNPDQYLKEEDTLMKYVLIKYGMSKYTKTIQYKYECQFRTFFTYLYII